MPPLNNPRHEKFVQALFEGRPANESYELAGYRPHDGNCIRLRGNERVRARLAELQEAVAKRSEVTVASLLDELEHARVRADGLDQLSAAVKAISEKAKISGLLVQRVEVGAPNSFAGCQTFEAIADEMLAGPGGPIEGFYPVDERDRQGLIELLTRQGNEVQEYLDAVSARPIAAQCVNPAALPSRWEDLQPHPSTRAIWPGNGSPRRIGNGNGSQR